MVPPQYSIFFTTMATVGATLFGLIFVAISIIPDDITAETGPVDRQVKATASYVALLNPLMISLFALVPYQLLGIAVSVLSLVGILNTIGMAASLIYRKDNGNVRLRNLILIFIALILYGFEGYIAIQLERPVVPTYWFSVLGDILIFISLFGIIRAWELIGIRQFRVREWFSKLLRVANKRVNHRANETSVDKDEEKKPNL